MEDGENQFHEDLSNYRKETAVAVCRGSALKTINRKNDGWKRLFGNKGAIWQRTAVLECTANHRISQQGQKSADDTRSQNTECNMAWKSRELWEKENIQSLLK